MNCKRVVNEHANDMMDAISIGDDVDGFCKDEANLCDLGHAHMMYATYQMATVRCRALHQSGLPSIWVASHTTTPSRVPTLRAGEAKRVQAQACRRRDQRRDVTALPQHLIFKASSFRGVTLCSTPGPE